MASTKPNLPSRRNPKTISGFKSFLKGGGSRNNLFEVELSYPPGAPIANVLNLVETGKWLIKSAALPSSQVTPIPVPFRGRELKVAGDRTFESWTITVMNDTDFKLRNGFERWMNFINNVASNRGETEPAAYMADAFVYQLDRNGDALRYYKFYDIYPSQISRMDLDYDNGGVGEFTVEMQVLYWEARAGNMEDVSQLRGQNIVSDVR